MSEQRWRITFYEIALVVFLLVSLFIRLEYVDYPQLNNSDPGRDYLMAHHVVAYGEFFVNGAGSSIGLINNPVYEYILAFFLLIHDDFFTLTIANILMQVGCILLVYLLAREMFDRRTGLAAALLFGSIGYVVLQSEYMWRVFLMQPVLLMSFYLLLLSDRKQSSKYLMLAGVAYAIAGSIQLIAFVLAPAFFFLAYRISRTWQRRWPQYAKCLVAFAGTLVLAYTPFLFYAARTGMQITPPGHTGSSLVFSLIEQSPPAIIHSFTTEVSMAALLFFDPYSAGSMGRLILALSLLVICVAVYIFVFKKERDEVRFLLVLCLTVLQLCAALSLMRLPVIEWHYVAPVLAPVSIAIAAVLTRIFSGTVLLNGVGFFVLAVLISVVSHSHGARNQPSDFRNLVAITAASRAIEREVVAIAARTGASDFHFFDIRAFHATRDHFNPYFESSFWNVIEKDFGQQFTTVTGGYGIEVAGPRNPEYVFLVCVELPFQLPVQRCIDAFVHDQWYPDAGAYRVIKKVYDEAPFVIFETTKS